MYTATGRCSSGLFCISCLYMCAKLVPNQQKVTKTYGKSSVTLISISKWVFTSTFPQDIYAPNLSQKLQIAAYRQTFLIHAVFVQRLRSKPWTYKSKVFFFFLSFLYGICGIAHVRTNREDDIFMQRRLMQNFTYILEWGRGTCTLTKHTRRWTYSALRYFLGPKTFSYSTF